MPTNADGPKTSPQIFRDDQLTQRGEPPSDKWKKNRKSDAKAQKQAMERQRAARLERDKG
jgi:uncharacterized protein YaiL (DUF2058 family)